MPVVGRKRWALHDGPQGSLRRLRNQLAEDGCAESQVVLAKQLLEEKCELEADKISNFKQALEWLICATEQAHPEARRMLRRCIRSGVIDEDSAAIVRAKSCLAASRQETVARKAARDLFASLSNGEQYITTAQLERRIREICSTTLRKEPDDTDSPDDDDSPEEARALGEEQALEPSQQQSGDHIHTNGTLRPTHISDEDYPETCEPNEDIRNLTVDNLVSAAVDYCQGELPLVTYDLTLTDPNLKALDHIPLFQQAFLHPIVFIQVLYLKLLYYFASYSFRLSNVELALLLTAYLSVSADSLYHLVPLVLYYVSFIAMVICTFKMLHAKRQFIDFRKWSGLFLRYSDGNLQPDESENMFVRNNLGPFLQFFLALFINLFLYPFIATQWVPFSEFCVLSFFLMFLTLFNFSFGTNETPYPDILALVSFAINVLAKYPYEKDTVVHQGWRFLDLHISNYPSYILGNSIEFCVNSRVFFSLLIPFILALMAKRSDWHGFFKFTMPHCVTLSWLQMFIVCSHGCTTYGLIRGTLGLVCSFLFLPLMGLLSVILPVFAFLQYITLSRVLYTVAIVLAFVLSLSVSCLLAKTEATKKFITPFQFTIGLLTLIYFGNQFVTNVQDDGLPSGLIDLIGDDKNSIKNLLKSEFITDYDDTTYHVSWEDYYNQCNSPSWTDFNTAETQIKCAVLDGANVNWEGYVQDVKLNSVVNRWRDFESWLPGFFKEYFKCYYGEEYETLCSGSAGSDLKECEFVQSVARQSGKMCHLDNFNEYTYEVKLLLDTGGGILKRRAQVTILFDHHFTNFTRLLRIDDKIRFRGVLANDYESYNIGSQDVTVKGHEIRCLECKNAQGTISTKVRPSSKFSDLLKTIVSDCTVSTKHILNFLLNPVVIFK